MFNFKDTYALFSSRNAVATALTPKSWRKNPGDSDGPEAI